MCGEWVRGGAAHLEAIEFHAASLLCLFGASSSSSGAAAKPAVLLDKVSQLFLSVCNLFEESILPAHACKELLLARHEHGQQLIRGPA